MRHHHAPYTGLERLLCVVKAQHAFCDQRQFCGPYDLCQFIRCQGFHFFFVYDVGRTVLREGMVDINTHCEQSQFLCVLNLFVNEIAVCIGLYDFNQAYTCPGEHLDLAFFCCSIPHDTSCFFCTERDTAGHAAFPELFEMGEGCRHDRRRERFPIQCEPRIGIIRIHIACFNQQRVQIVSCDPVGITSL